MATNAITGIEQLEVVNPQESKKDQYMCTRCGFRTSEGDVLSKHSAGCKVSLNNYSR